MFEPKPGDVVVTHTLRGGSYRSRFSDCLIGVVSRIEGTSIWGDWRYDTGWREDSHSDLEDCEFAPADIADLVLADWTVWRLTQ